MTVALAPPDELPSGVTHVTPTRRLAHHLLARHHAACVESGLRAWRTPDVVTWQELLRRLFETDRAAGLTGLRWLPASHARLAWEQIVRLDPAQAQVLARAGLAATAHRSWVLLHRYRIPTAALEQADGVEAAAFARWVVQYQRWLEAGGWLDPALASTIVGRCVPETPLSFVGFDHWTPEQAAFLDRLRAGGVPVITTEPLSGDAPIAARVVECDDFDAELDAAARWAAARLQERPRERLALIVPGLDRERVRVRRALDRVLVPQTAVTGGPAPGSKAWALAAARPLLERPVVAAALAWLEACATPADAALASALLLGHHDGAAAAESHARAELDVELRRSGLEVRGLEHVAAAARRMRCPGTAARLERVIERARRWHGAHPPSHWAPEFSGLLVDLGWPGADPDSVEHQAAQRWQELLGELGAGDDVTGALRVTAAIGHLRDLASQTSFEPQEIAAPLLVIDPETALGMRFDAVWIVGLDASRWPAPASPDPFLPRDWQVRQAVPGVTAELAEAAARRTLVRLTHAAPAVICSVPRFAAEAPLLPSAWVAELPRAAGIERWNEVEAAVALFEARPALVREVDGVLPAFGSHEIARGGARLLELQAACPFRAAVELRLGGRQLDDPAVGIEPTERGKLAHAVLQAFWSEVRDQARLLALSPEQRRQKVADAVDAVLLPLRQRADEVRVRLLEFERRWLGSRTLELLALDVQREPFTVEYVEVAREIDVGGVQVRVVIDRVDRLGDGSCAFIDYKTGANARPGAWLAERPELPQLPLYVRTVVPADVGAVAFASLRKGATAYAGFTREASVFSQLKAFDPAKAAFRDYADWSALLREWERRLDALAREHAEGDARLAPQPARACVYCHLAGVCRSRQARLEPEEGDDAAP